MGFSAIWSVHTMKTSLVPNPRSDFFISNCPDLDLAVIGLGFDGNHNYFNDIWCLNKTTLEWTELTTTGEQISPRCGARSIYSDSKIYVFGGMFRNDYFNDLYQIDLQTGLVTSIQTQGVAPSPRTSPITGLYKDHFFVWGGFDGMWPPQLYALDLNTRTWEAKDLDVTGRSGASFIQIENKIYVFGGSKCGGMLVIDLEDRSAAITPMTGVEPPCTIVDSTMLRVGDFIIVFGGKHQNNYSFVHCCDIARKRWFILHSVPDGRTTSEEDGAVNEFGLFQFPRAYSLGAVYSEKQRRIIAFLGSPMNGPEPIHLLDVGDALGVINLRSDMLDIFERKMTF